MAILCCVFLIISIGRVTVQICLRVDHHARALLLSFMQRDGLVDNIYCKIEIKTPDKFIAIFHHSDSISNETTMTISASLASQNGSEE